jgi:hypothetical protein
MQDVMAERHTGTVEPQVLTEMMQLVCRLRGGIGALYDYAWQPVPFFYVHFIYLASGVYLPLAAFALARDDHMQVGLGRIVALYYRSSTSYHIR